MSEDNGDWLKVYRKMKDSRVWHYTDAQFKVWMTILLSVNWDESWARVGGEEKKLEPGQMVTSRQHLANESGVSGDIVYTTWEKLEEHSMIHRESHNDGTLITVLNWDKYQQRGKPGHSDTHSDSHNDSYNESYNESYTHKEVQEREEHKESTRSDSDESGTPDRSKEGLSDEYGDMAVRATDYLRDQITQFNERTPVPDWGTKNMESWVQAMDRLNRLGPPGGDNGYSWKEIRKIVDWIFTEDSRQSRFWAKNVQSATGLRDKVHKIENDFKDEKTQSNGGDLPNPEQVKHKEKHELYEIVQEHYPQADDPVKAYFDDHDVDYPYDV